MMKAILIALAAIALISSTMFLMHKKTPTTPALQASEDLTTKFQEWCTKYRVHMSGPEESYRLQVFGENLNKIQSHPEDSTYSLGENQFMILTKNEFKSQYLGLISKPESLMREFHTEDDIDAVPATVDWTKKGKVQAVKDQGQCGSCWAFSAVGAIESSFAVFKGTLGDFSEQQLVDCSTSFGNQGCNGGLMDYAFQYVIKNGITTESAYPYRAVDQKCKTKGGPNKIQKFTDVPSGNCNALQTAVNQQPIAIGVDAESWQFYSGGIYPASSCGTQLDHGVLAVGYTNPTKSGGFWKVKNSWGTSWGEAGFIRLGNGNACGICNTASYPSVSK